MSRLREDMEALLEAGRSSNKKLAFPSHDVMDLEKKYHDFDRYFQKHARKGDPKHRKAMDKALGTFVTLLAQLKDAENTLYY